MNHQEASKTILFLSTLLIIINLYLSYVFSGRSLAYIVGNVFSLTMMVMVISSFFPKYRNSRSRWIITLNIMIITFIVLMSGAFIKAAKEVGHANANKIQSIKTTDKKE